MMARATAARLSVQKSEWHRRSGDRGRFIGQYLCRERWLLI
jgi:hypothetical protein